MSSLYSLKKIQKAWEELRETRSYSRLAMEEKEMEKPTFP
jgi:hypothetical protein